MVRAQVRQSLLARYRRRAPFGDAPLWGDGQGGEAADAIEPTEHFKYWSAPITGDAAADPAGSSP